MLRGAVDDGIGRQWAIGFLIVFGVVPFIGWLWRQTTPRPAPPTAAALVMIDAASADAFIEESSRLFRVGRFEDCIVAARRALMLASHAARALNNQAACYGGLRQFDEEIRLARAALRIDPSLTLAQRNLDWALAQKRTLAPRAPND